MSGHGSWSGQGERPQRTSNGAGSSTQEMLPAVVAGSEGMGGGTQDQHNRWGTAAQIRMQLKIGAAEAKDLKNAIYEPQNGGFTWGWDSVIRAYENGASESDIMKLTAGKYDNVQKLVDAKYGGDRSAYMKEVAKKARNCEKLIDLAPKWNGAELTRGFKKLDASTFADLTRVGSVVDLNNGTASWTTTEDVARGFAGYKLGTPTGSFVAHCSGARRGTSIRNLSRFKREDEVLCSKNEAFQCVRVERRKNGEVHAYYRLIDANHDWTQK